MKSDPCCSFVTPHDRHINTNFLNAEFYTSRNYKVSQKWHYNQKLGEFQRSSEKKFSRSTLSTIDCNFIMEQVTASHLIHLNIFCIFFGHPVYTDLYKLCGNVANHIIRQQGNKLLPRIIAVIKKCFVPEGKK